MKMGKYNDLIEHLYYYSGYSEKEIYNIFHNFKCSISLEHINNIILSNKELKYKNEVNARTKKN